MRTAGYAMRCLEACMRRGYVFHLYNSKGHNTVYCEVDVTDGHTLCGEGASISAAVEACDTRVRDYEARKR